jgi:hypothetical protein
MLVVISELPQSSGRSATGGDSNGQYQASGCPDGALHQCCVPGGQPPSSTPSRPPNGGNGGTGGNQNKYNNKNCNSGNGGGNNGKNSNGGGGHGDSSGQTTAPTGSDGRTNALWPTYGHPWQGHMIMYPGLVPVGQQRPQAFMTTPGL